MSVMGCFVVGCNRLFEDESIAHIFLTCKCMRIRKLAEGVVSEPFCHLVIKAIRVDSHPFQNSPQSFAELLTKYRIRTGLSQIALAAKLGVSISHLIFCPRPAWI